MSRKDQEDNQPETQIESVLKEVKEGFFIALNGLGVALFGLLTVGVVFILLSQALQRKQTVEETSNQETEPFESSNQYESNNPSVSSEENSKPKTSLENDIDPDSSQPNSSSNNNQIEEQKRDTKNTKGSKQVANQGSPETRVVDPKPIEVNGLVLSVDKIHRDVDLEGDKPVGEFIVIEGTIKNTSKETGILSTSYFWSDFYLRDNQQREFSNVYKYDDPQSNAREKYGASLRNTDIPPGLSIDIAIVFDINPSATGLELVWDPKSLVKKDKVIDLSPSDKTASSSKSKSAGTSLPESGTAFYPDRDNPFVDASYPQSTCGDRAPTDPAEYPVSFFPVYVDHTPTKLEKIQSGYCEDALQIVRDNGETSIQVGSFRGKERAKMFRNFLNTQFSSAEVGEKTTLKEPNS